MRIARFTHEGQFGAILLLDMRAGVVGWESYVEPAAPYNIISWSPGAHVKLTACTIRQINELLLGAVQRALACNEYAWIVCTDLQLLSVQSFQGNYLHLFAGQLPVCPCRKRVGLFGCPVGKVACICTCTA